MIRSLLQEDLSGGMWRSAEGQKIPANSCYDIENGLLDDEGSVYRRGGSTYDSVSAVPATVLGVSDLHLAAGRRTVMWTATQGFMYTAGGGSVFTIASTAPAALTRPVVIGGLAVFMTGVSSPSWVLYGGGSLGQYTTGTISVTNGSKTVTGVGTNWTSGLNAEQGMILGVGGVTHSVIDSVDSPTQLTLRSVWHGSTAAGTAYTIDPSVTGSGIFGATRPVSALAAVGTPARLMVASGNQVYFSEPGIVQSFTETNYHELPAGARVLAMEGLGDTLLVFATDGIWRIANLNFDLTDDAGNVQHTVSQVNRDLIVWGQNGISAWRGAFVVPAVEDIYLLSLDGQVQSLGRPITTLYRTYVKAGHKSGTAVVHRGHYFLPIVDTSNVLVDVLVCKLDSASWSRWSGHAACIAYTQRVSTGGTPALLGAQSTWVVDLSSAFEPAAAVKNDADGTAHVLTLVTRSLRGHQHLKSLWKKFRLRFILNDAAADDPTVTLDYTTGDQFTSWTAVSGAATERSTGEAAYSWLLPTGGKRAQAIAFRVRSSGSASSFLLRSLEVFYRPQGRK